MSILFQAIAFFIIAANFIFLVLAVIEPWLRLAFCKPTQRREAVIIPFPDVPARGGESMSDAIGGLIIAALTGAFFGFGIFLIGRIAALNREHLKATFRISASALSRMSFTGRGVDMATRPRTRPIEFISDLPAANRPGKIISALTEAYPHSLSAKTLMEEMGLPWQAHPVPSFVSLCIDFQGINRGLRAYGWQAMRSNGTPFSNYRLSPIGGG